MPAEYEGNGKIRQVWMIAGILIGSVGINQGIQTTTNTRHDSFTGTEAAAMRRDILGYMEFEMARHHLEIPPEPTRLRIKAIERCLELKCTDFVAPTQKWYEHKSTFKH